MEKALGLIEAQGLTTAVTALDAASKAADITLIGIEKVIGVNKGIGVSINIAGEVAAVKAAVDAGVIAGNRVGSIISSHIIPRPHDEVDKLIEKFAKNLKTHIE
jgi:microcompartment protein CcmL/EutN